MTAGPRRRRRDTVEFVSGIALLAGVIAVLFWAFVPNRPTLGDHLSGVAGLIGVVLILVGAAGALAAYLDR